MASLSYQSVADRVADRVVTGVERAEGVAVSSAGSIAGAIAAGARRLPTPAKPAVLGKTRVAGRIPSVQQIAETNFAVLEKLLAAQKHYAVSVLGAFGAGSKATAAPAAKATAAAQPAPRTAKAAPARRPAAKKPSA